MSDPLADSWYPSCVVKLTLRYDESLHIAGAGDVVSAKQAAATSQEKRITQGKRPRRALNEPTGQIELEVVSVIPLGPDARRANNQGLSELDEFRQPLGQENTVGATTVGNRAGVRDGVNPADVSPLTFGSDGFTVISNRVPKTGTFVLPHPRSAGTFKLSFDYLDFPIDPRLIRAAGVEIHLGTVSPADFARGMAGEKAPDGRPLSVLSPTTSKRDPVSRRPGVNHETLLFYGTADTWEVEHGSSGSGVTFEGRDIRGIMIDAKVPLAKIAAIDLSKPINEVVEDIIKTMGIDHDFRLTVATDAAEWENGVIPSPGDADGMTRVRLPSAGEGGEGGGGKGGKGGTSTPATGTKTSYWDLITNYCTLVGSMPQIVGSTLWIRPNHRIFDVVSKRSKIATPFSGGVTRTIGSEKIRVRRMVYGRDINKLRYQRKFQGAVVPTIQTISFDDTVSGTQRLIFGQWPAATTITAKTKSETEVQRIPIWGIRSVKQLTDIARGIYEEIGRGETGGTAETSNLATLGGNNSDPDLLHLRPLEPIEFVVDASALHRNTPVVSELNDIERRTFSEEVDILHRRIGDRQVARALVALARGAVRELLTFYQVIGVQFDWNNGIKTQIQFQNYIVPRNAVATGDDTTTATDIRSARVEVVGEHRKAKVGAATREIGNSNPTPLDDGIELGPAEVKPVTPGKRVRNLKPPKTTVGPASGEPL